MKITILAWGSLVWSRRDIAVVGDFEPNGPRLPIEFSRVSGDGRLTLVIDEAFGSPCATYSAVSAFDDLDAAIGNLWVCENKQGAKTPADLRGQKTVGFVDLTTGAGSAIARDRHAAANETIKTWVIESGYNAAIWTSLRNNFHEPDKANEQFSVEAAIQYLDRVDKVTFARGLHYVWNAPPEVQTPVRAAVNIRWPEG